MSAEWGDEVRNCSAKWGGEDLLRAIPSVLGDNVAPWWRSTNRDIGSWRDFRKAFRHQFNGDLTHGEVME